MMLKVLPLRRWRTHPFLQIFVVVCLFSLWWFRDLIHTTWTLLSLPSVWWRDAPQFLISEDATFDVTFANYSQLQETAGPTYPDRIPSVLHHIVLGSSSSAVVEEWKHVRQSCLDMHPGWETHLWTDENAGQFMAERFPQFKKMWDDYQYPIQRIDALRYFVLYEYGGAVLDMDLRCKRSLGPLRRYQFVAPAAHPVGFSNGFMMATKHSEFIGSIIENLRTYKRHWFGLPYPTVMFSTGCHYASTIHALQPNRTELKILSGPNDDFKLHSLNGHVSTPLFDHLGSSSWHSFDAALIVWFGHLQRRHILFLLIGITCIIFLMSRLRICSRHRGLHVSVPWQAKKESGFELA